MQQNGLITIPRFARGLLKENNQLQKRQKLFNMKLNNHDTVYFRAIITWLLFIPIAVLNGTLRELVYRPFTGELAAHQISTATASIAFFTLAYFCLRHHLQTTSRNTLF